MAKLSETEPPSSPKFRRMGNTATQEFIFMFPQCQIRILGTKLPQAKNLAQKSKNQILTCFGPPPKLSGHSAPGVHFLGFSHVEHFAQLKKLYKYAKFQITAPYHKPGLGFHHTHTHTHTLTVTYVGTPTSFLIVRQKVGKTYVHFHNSFPLFSAAVFRIR